MMSVTVRILCTWLLWQWQVWLVWLFLAVCRPDEQSPNHVLIWLVLWFHLGFSCELSWVSKKLLTGHEESAVNVLCSCQQAPQCIAVQSVIVANSMAAFLSLFWFCDKMAGWTGIIYIQRCRCHCWPVVVLQSSWLLTGKCFIISK